MTPDQAAWLNQGRKELGQALAVIDRATSDRRKDDLAHALASLARVREIIVWADDCHQRATSGFPFTDGRHP